MKIPIPKSNYEYSKLSDLLARWETTQNVLLEHGKNEDLEINIPWSLVREREHNKVCILTDEYVKPLILLDNTGYFDFRSPCWECDCYLNEERCKFEFPPMFDMNNQTSSQLANLRRVT